MMAWVEDAEVRKALREPFKPEQIGKLPKPTKKENTKGKCSECGGWHGLPAVHLDFVGHAAVSTRLNNVVPGWFYTIDEMFNHDGACWLRGTFTVDGISRPEYGDGKNPKEALGNLIRRGAMRFGVATELWSKEELEESADIEPVPSGSLQGSPGDGMVDADGSGVESTTQGEGTSDPTGEPLAYGEGAGDSVGDVGRPDGQGNAESDESASPTPSSGELQTSPVAAPDVSAPSGAPSTEQRKDFRDYLAQRYGTDQALLMARHLFQTQAKKVPNLMGLNLDELQAIDAEFKSREVEVPA